MLGLLAFLFAFAAGMVFTANPAQLNTARVLIFSATLGYRHDSIPTAIACMQAQGPTYRISFDDTEDATQFNDATLSNYDAILFLDVSDVGPPVDILNTTQQQAFQNFLDKGGNFVGIHSATDCLHDVAFYGNEIGAYFDNHPNISEATFLNDIDPTHPIVSMIPPRWTYEEEVYNFKSDPRDVGAVVILTVDQSQEGGDPYASIQGTPHPIVWYQERGAGASANAVSVGRSFYTALGHLNSTWQNETFIEHVMAGISWSLASNTTRAFNTSGLVGNAASDPPATSGASASGSASATSITSTSPAKQSSGAGGGGSGGALSSMAVAAAAAVMAPFLVL